MAKKSSVWPWIFGAVAVLWLAQDDSPSAVVSVQAVDSPASSTQHRINTPQKTPIFDGTVSTNIETTLKKAEPAKRLAKVGPTTPKPRSRIKASERPATKPVPKIATAPEPARTMYVDASRLNVRSGPSKSDKVIWTLKRDQAVRVTRQKGDWSYLEGGRYKGWVFGGFLTPKKSAPIKTAKRPTPKKKIKKRRSLSTAAIKKLLIKRSMAYYSGNCPCPYFRDRAGRKCGRRSAYSRPGGASPLCYNRDVTAQMVRDFRARQ